METTKGPHLLALAALTLAALALRLAGIGHSAPYFKEADAHIPAHVERLRKGLDAPDARHNDIQYPLVLPGLIALLPDTQPEPPPGASLEEHLSAASHPMVETRVVIAVLSALLVPLTYAFARRFVAARWALFAAAVIAVSLLHQFFSQQARPHGASATVYLLAVLAAMRLARRAKWPDYLLATVGAGLSIGTLHSGLAVMVPLVVAAFVAALVSVHESPPRVLARLAAVPVLALAVPVASVVAFYPFLFRGGQGAEYGKPRIDGTALIMGDHTIDLRDFLGQGAAIVGRTLVYYEPVLLALLAVALVVWWRSRREKRERVQWFERSDLAVALAYALPYLLAIAMFRHTYERFLLPLLPFAATFAAWGLARLCARVKPAVARAIAAVAVASLALPAFASGRYAWLHTRDDTLELAAKWLTRQPDATAAPIYVAPFFDLPLAYRKTTRTDRPWTIYQSRRGAGALPDPKYDVRYLAPRRDLTERGIRPDKDADEFVRALGPGYFVYDASRQPARPELSLVHEALKRNAVLAHEPFSPTEDAATRDWGLHFEDELFTGWPCVFTRVLRARALGPVVEIYRVEAR